MRLSAKNLTLNILLVCLLAVLVTSTSYAQSAAINTDGSSADPSAALDIKSTTRGLLIPRMSNADRTALVNPATSLVIFQNDGVPGYYYNSGTPGAPVWVQLLPTNGNGSLLTNLNASALATGLAGTARLGTGAANSGTFLRGDGTWAAPPGASGDGSLLTNLNASALATGIAGTARLGTGAANSGTFLRGDGTWAAVSLLPGLVSGTLNVIPKFTATTNLLTNSLLFDDGSDVGLGTLTPSYRLDILHGGSTGIRNKSSSSFSVLDIDAFSGDAAIRFANNGTNQWNLRNQPGTDNLQIFELGGGGERFAIQNSTGNIAIGGSTGSYRLDVLHDGSTGILNKSSASFSVLDIDAFSGDASIRFVKNGVNQWNTRNNPATDDYQIFELGGGGERMRIDNTTGKVWVNNDFTVLGVKAFTMDHPLDPENRTLMHAAVESNEVLNSYSGNVVTDANGKASVQLPDYFEAINKDFRYQLTVVGGMFAQAMISKEISGNKFEIATSQPNVKVSWEVKGVRNDARMQRNPFTPVQEKTAAQKGKYVDAASHNQPASKGVSYDPSVEGGKSSISDVAPAAKPAKEVPSKGGSLDQPPVSASKSPASSPGRSSISPN